MEKPGVPYQWSYDRNDRESAAAAYALRHYERVVPKTVSSLTDRTEPDGKPVWRGDHSFSSDAAAYALTNFIEPEITKKHPDWSKKKVAEAAQEQFAKRLSQDLSYERRERSHDETVVRWQPVEMEDGTTELATEYGGSMITLKELWDHTREYAAFVGNPAAYNREEERAQLSMQEEFLHGSSSAYVSVLSHPDSVRYMQIWEKSDDGSVVSHQVDLYKTTGRDFSYDEGNAFVRHLERYYAGAGDQNPRETVSAYAHFFTSRMRIDEQEMRLLAVAASMRQSGASGREGSVPAGVRPLGAEPPQEAKRGMDTLMAVGAYLREHLSLARPVKQDDAAEHAVRKRNGRRMSPENRKQSAGGRNAVGEKAGKHILPGTDISGVHVSEASDAIRVRGEKTLPPVTPVRRMMTEWYVSMRYAETASRVSSLSVAAIRMLAPELPGGIHKRPEGDTEHKAMAPAESISDRLPPTGIRHLMEMTVNLVSRITAIPAAFRKMFPSRESGRTQTEPAIPAKEPPVSGLKRAGEQVVYRVRRIAEGITRTLVRMTERVLRPSAGTGGTAEAPVSTPTEPVRIASQESVNTNKEESVALEGIREALIIWFLFARGDARPAEERSESIPVSGRTSGYSGEIRESREQQGDTVFPGLFVLLAIIRHLSLLRESGKVTGVKAAGSAKRHRVRRIMVWGDAAVSRSGRRSISLVFAS